MAAESMGGEATRREVAAKAVASVKRFSMLPEITLRIVEVVGDERCTAGDLNRVVSNDPALCMRILKVVNSAFYGLPHPVASLERAIVLLGGEAIKGIAIAASFGRLVQDGARSAVSPKALWLHSLAVGVAARGVAEAAGFRDTDEVFLCGLLHDVGFLVEMRQKPAALGDVAAEHARGERPVTQIEDDAFGANHSDFGRALCEQWQLPGAIAEVVGAHEHPLLAENTTQPAACAVHVADALAAAAGFGFIGRPPGQEMDAGAAAALGIDAAVLDEIVDALPERTAELRDALGG